MFILRAVAKTGGWLALPRQAGIDHHPRRRYPCAMHPPGSRARIVINDGARVVFSEPGRPLLFALMSERIFIPSACGGRASCGQCKVRVLSGAEGYAAEELPLISEKDRQRGIHLACQVRIGPETRIEIPDTSLRARQYKSRIVSLRDLAPDMREVTLELLSPAAMPFKAGQYVQFLIPGTEQDPQPLYRAYSVASPPSSSGRLTLVFGRIPGGVCSSYVFERLHTEDEVTVNGPFGEFYLRDSERDILLVAGGSGMAPLRGMLMDMAEKHVTRAVTYYFTARTARDLFYVDEMRARERDMPRFRFVPVLSNPGPREGWEGEKGGIASALNRLLPALSHHEAYLCGSPGMIDASIGVLRARGLRNELIFYDKFS
jgi:Na+-transporting NADH:ubiquinone oxidoreductase subunit F